MSTVKKGYIKNKDTGKVKSFLYNPSDFSDSKSTTFGEISAPGSSYPRFQYINGGARTVSFDVYVRGKASEVNSHLNFLEEFLPKRGTKFSKPPILIFAMGSYVKECILQDIGRNFTRFDNNLNATEVTVSLKLTEV